MKITYVKKNSVYYRGVFEFTEEQINILRLNHVQEYNYMDFDEYVEEFIEDIISDFNIELELKEFDQRPEDSWIEGIEE